MLQISCLSIIVLCSVILKLVYTKLFKQKKISIILYLFLCWLSGSLKFNMVRYSESHMHMNRIRHFILAIHVELCTTNYVNMILEEEIDSYA